jgi:tRNA A-37 threonylcarbamoyl transferase component Bud32
MPWPFLGPPQQPGEIGRLAQYRVLKQLGQGGMGIVFRAEDEQLRRPAALKVMRPDFAAQEDARSRFLREARAAAALKHDHIVTIYQVGEHDGVPFLAMEFLAGKSLEEWLRPDRRATVAETLNLGKQIARGLAAAHAAGLVHRDIKPANLWLEAPRGRVKILDFGLARITTGELTALTQDGAVLGTPAYMAPEQARGEVVDQRGDLYSMGCVLYRMVTGLLPFQGHTMYAVLAAIATETPPPVRQTNPDVPPRLADLIERLLSKSPGDRPASAQAVFDELQQIEKEFKEAPAAARGEAPASAKTPPDSEPVTRSNAWRLGLVVALGVAGLAVVLGLAWKFSGDGNAPSSAQQPGAAPAPPPVAPPVDLLKLIDLDRDQGKGIWTLGKRGLRGRSDPGDKGKVKFTLVLPWEPPAEYRLKLTVRRLTDEPGALGVGLAHGEARFNMLFDLGEEKFHTGIGAVEGKKLMDRTDGHVGQVLPPRVTMRLACTVEVKKVTVEANGGRIYAWHGDLNTLERPYIQAIHPLMFYGGTGDFGFDEIILEPLGPERGRPYDASKPK